MNWVFFGGGPGDLAPVDKHGRLRESRSHFGFAVDPRIKSLGSTTLRGRRLTRKPITAVQQTVLSFPGPSRPELAHMIAEQLRWHAAKGDTRVQAAPRLLEELERQTVLSLPGRI